MKEASNPSSSSAPGDWSHTVYSAGGIGLREDGLISKQGGSSSLQLSLKQIVTVVSYTRQELINPRHVSMMDRDVSELNPSTPKTRLLPLPQMEGEGLGVDSVEFKKCVVTGEETHGQNTEELKCGGGGGKRNDDECKKQLQEDEGGGEEHKEHKDGEDHEHEYQEQRQQAGGEVGKLFGKIGSIGVGSSISASAEVCKKWNKCTHLELCSRKRISECRLRMTAAAKKRMVLHYIYYDLHPPS
eukprot:jgi/Bigna1/72199/fgenesh1_pg.18_\